MPAYELATPEQCDEFLQMMLEEMSGYLEQTIRYMQMTWEEFVELFRARGLVYALYQDGSLAGYYWIELRGRVLHLHGLVILPEFRGCGIGTQVLRKLVREYANRIDAIELGVKDENIRARHLYEQEGFRVTDRLQEIGFTIMQKPIPAQDSTLDDH